MKRVFIFSFLVFTSVLFAQPNTDVFLFDLNINGGEIELSHFRNISDNDGYDNQPSFEDNNTILYAGTRNGQTDIVKYNINYESKIFINHTEGSEYSPLKIPGQRAASAIRLDKDGAQKLYKYNLRNGESELLIEDIVIGYHIWQNEDIIISSVLEEGLSLYISDINKGTNTKVDSNIGRSLHKIPNTNLVSYISKKDENSWVIKSIDPTSEEIKNIVATLPKSEDMCWHPNGSILMGKDNDLYLFEPNKNLGWTKAVPLEKYKIKNISRIIVSPDGSKLAVVGEGGINPISETENKPDRPIKEDNPETTEAETIVKRMMEAYNKRDIDAYMSFYASDVKLYNYPNKIQTEGAETMRESYTAFFKNTPDLNGYIKKRMVLGNKVIDEAQVTINGKILNALAVYEINNGKITRVTFIQ